MTERKGKAIFLNGTSSSGKTTIARALQQTLAEPYLHLSVDAFLHQCPEAFLRDDQRLGRELPFLLAGFNSSCAAIARAGNNIIVDHVLQEPSWLLPCVTLYQGLEVVFIAVRCSLEKVDRREKMRGDRRAGMARYQYERVHAHGLYDVEVDTSEMSVNECVSLIHKYVHSGKQPTAFEQLRVMATGCEQGTSADANKPLR